MFENILNFTLYLLDLTVQYETLAIFWYFILILMIIHITRQVVHL